MKQNNNNRYGKQGRDDISALTAINWFPNFDNLKSRQGTDSINIPLSTQGAETNFIRTKRQT